jgi:preprotein translocase subunit SecA
MHAQVQRAVPETSTVQDLQTFSSDDVDASGAASMQSAARSVGADEGDGEAPSMAAAQQVQEAPAMKPIVKDDWSKTPRNAPCPCGSGKKFKMCHGKT